MQPKFSIKCDSTEPDITSCMATFEFTHTKLCQTFSTADEAMKMDALVQLVFKESYRMGALSAFVAVVDRVNELRYTSKVDLCSLPVT